MKRIANTRARIWCTGLQLVVALAAVLAPHGARAQAAGAASGPPAQALPSAQAAQSAPARRALEDFAAPPMVRDLSLSPDGQRFATLLSRGDETLLLTSSLIDGKNHVAMRTDNQRVRFAWARWVNNERLLLSLHYADKRRGIDSLETRLVSVRYDGSAEVNMVRKAPGERFMRQIQDEVIDWMPEDGRHVLMQWQERPNSVVPAVYRVDVETAEFHLVHGSHPRVGRWWSDRTHRVRVGLFSDADAVEVRACDADGSNWRSLWRFERESIDVVRPLGFGADPNQLFIEADHQGRRAVFSVDLKSSTLERRLRLADPEFDVRGELVHSPRGGEAVGLRDRDAGDRSDWWDPTWRAIAQDIDRRLPGRYNRLLQVGPDERRYLVYSSGNGVPGEYLLGDRQAGTLGQLADQFPQLRELSLVGKKPVRFTARDGLMVPAYLSRPAALAPGRRPPLLVLPHGGLSGHGGDDFDAWTEFLVNRGYAVLQVNARGASGYGFDFRAAGLQRWGLEKQDDLSDAVRWAVAEQGVDGSRVCIVGQGWGGYAALMGAVRTPQLYRCAVSVNGVSDLVDMIQRGIDYVGGKAALEAQLGHAWQDRQRLAAASPSRQAERVGVPVLLIAGDEDRAVPVAQSQAMASALRSAGKPHRYIELDGADHSLSRRSHRVAMFKAVEAFLDEQLGDAKREP